MGKLKQSYEGLVQWILAHKKIVIPIFYLALILVPFVIKSRYVMWVICLIGIYSILTMSLNLIAGYMGQTSMGHAALYMIGAYCCRTSWIEAWLTVLDHPAFWNPGRCGRRPDPGTCDHEAFGLLSGGDHTGLRRSGGDGSFELEERDERSAGCPEYSESRYFFGFKLSPTNGGYYWLMLALVTISVLISLNVLNSRFGRAVRAIKDDELAAKLMGVHTAAFRVKTIALSGAMAGMAGAFYVSMNHYIDAATFSYDVSMTILCIVIFGGLGSIPGMIVGAPAF